MDAGTLSSPARTSSRSGSGGGEGGGSADPAPPARPSANARTRHPTTRLSRITSRSVSDTFWTRAESALLHALDRREQVLEEERRERGAAVDPGLRVERARLHAHGAVAGRAQRRDLLQRESLQQEERDLALGLGQAPARELHLDRLAETGQEAARLAAPALALHARQLEVVNQRSLLALLTPGHLEEKNHADAREHGGDDVEQLESHVRTGHVRLFPQLEQEIQGDSRDHGENRPEAGAEPHQITPTAPPPPPGAGARSPYRPGSAPP